MSVIKPFLEQCVGLTRNQFRSRLKETTAAYCGSMDVVLQHGRHWECYSPTKFSRDERGQCFANAQRLAMMYEDLTYVEGYAMSIIPLHHGWCVDRDGRVVDTTWGMGEPREYFGVPINTRYIRKIVFAGRSYTAVFENWVVDPPQPILTGRHKQATWLKPWTPTNIQDEGNVNV